jgi:hypothetical protein
MITTFFRSSSYNTWDFCPHKYYLSYVLGMKEPSGKKAVMGSIVHKALELLAWRKLAEQNGDANVHDEETGLTKPRHAITPKAALAAGWDFYTSRETHHEWFPRDRKSCEKWLLQGLEFRDGLYNPLQRKVVAPEQYFSFAIEEPWAEYRYKMPDGSLLEGYLGLKGTIDLVTEHPIGVLEYLDWKTGQRKDWATGKEKDFWKLCDDPQLRMYHYALSRLYPDAKEIFVTIFYVQFLEPFSICFMRDDLKKTEQMLRKRFDLIRSTTNPPWIRNNPAHSWKCSNLCHFGKTKHSESDKTVCQHIRSELVSLGMEKVNAKYMDVGKVISYGDGGGQSGRV